MVVPFLRVYVNVCMHRNEKEKRKKTNEEQDKKDFSPSFGKAMHYPWISNNPVVYPLED